MGIGMQVTFIGFARSHAIEAEASVRLVRLERVGRTVAECNLTITASRHPPGLSHAPYTAQLDLIMRDGVEWAGSPISDDDPDRAVGAAFGAAEALLQAGLGGSSATGVRGRPYRE